MATTEKFLKKCHLIWHEDSDVVLELHDLTQRRFVSAAVYEYIMNHQLVSDSKTTRTVRICSSCILRVKEHIQEPCKRTKVTIPTEPVNQAMSSMSLAGQTDNMTTESAVYTVCSALLNGTINSTQRKTLMDATAKVIASELQAAGSRDPANRIQSMFCSSYVHVWETQPDGNLKDLLESFLRNQKTDETGCRKLVKSMDILHWLLDPKYLSNISIGEAVLLEQFCQSRNGVELLSRVQPSGSYTTVRRSMLALNTAEKAIPKNDIIFGIKKNMDGKIHGKQIVSAVTAMVFFDMGSSSQNQFTISVPTALFPTHENRNLLIERYKAFSKESDGIHRKYRKQLIESILETLKADCKKIGSNIVDSISIDNQKNAGFDEAFNYKRVKPTQRCFPINDLDCMDVNPNSYASVQKVLDKIQDYIKQTDRKFIPVVIDGSPYSMCLNIVRESYVCSICQKTITSADMSTHTTVHAKAVPTFSRKYKEIIIRPGNGHVEMTAVKSILSFFWVPFIKPIAKLMGYTTENSLQYAKKGCDHHKSYNLLMIIFEALAYELVYPYVNWCLLHGEPISYEKFCDWEKKISQKNATFQIAMDFTFTTLHSLHLFRCAIRSCNDSVSLAARDKLTSLFYIMNNTKYQEIICYDTLYLLTLSSVGQKAVGVESSCGAGGLLGEGFDFLLENRNKVYKSFMTNELTPTFDQWLTVSRTTSELLQLRKNAAARLEMNLTTGDSQKLRLGNEVFQTRKYIRSLNLLLDKEIPFMSFDKTPVRLDSDGIVYVTISRKNQLEYYKSYAENEKLHTTALSITPEEFVDKNASYALVKEAVEAKILALHEPFFSLYKNAIKQLNGLQDLLNLHKAVKVQIQAQIEKDLEDEMLLEVLENGDRESDY